MRRQIAALSLLVACLTLDTTSLGPSGSAWAFSGSGAGIAVDPYVITTIQQLQEMADDLTAYYILGNDIDASDTVNWNGGEGFLPVGTYTGDPNDEFRGTLDGMGYSIQDLYIDRINSSRQGLFGFISSATIKNVNLINAAVSADKYTGILAGTATSNSTIAYCSATGTVTLKPGYPDAKSGGLIGSVNNGSKVQECFSGVNVNAGYRNQVGVLVGYLRGRDHYTLVSNSYSTGTVTGNALKQGNLIGDADGSYVDRCYSCGNRRALIGYNYSDPVITNCYWDKDKGAPYSYYGGKPKTTAEMMQQATFVGWDFVNTWYIVENETYPFLRLEGPGAIIWISDKELSFFADEGGSNPESQSLSIRNWGEGVLNWEITYDCNWLSVVPNKGSSTGEVDVLNLSVDVLALDTGQYNCELTISDPCAINSPQMVYVNLIIPCPGILLVPAEYLTIQAAIDDCNNGDVVIVAQGTYTGTGNKNLDYGGKAITVRSIDPEDPCVVAETVIDCENSGRGFYFHSGEGENSIVSGLSIKRGKVTGRPAVGGAIYCSGASPTIKNCVITSNQARGSYGDPHGENAYGGGVYCKSNSYLTLIDCTVSSNRAIGGEGDSEWCSPISGCYGGLGDGGGAYGGGIYSSSDSSLTIVGSIITDNSALGGSGGVYYETGDPITGAPGGWARGGGIYSGSAATIINNCSIVSNTATGGSGGHGDTLRGSRGAALGGGVCGTVAISNCTISGNYASLGGGMLWVPITGGGGICCTSSSSIVNCLITDNSVTFFGTGIYVLYSGNHSVIKGCTISNNTASYYPAYAVDDCDNMYYVAATITDSIIWNHNGYDVSSVCSVTYSCLEQSVVGIGNIHTDPCFVTGPLGDNYLSQVAAGQAVDSPCVNAGSDLAANLGMDICTTRTDQIGDAGIVDMGYHYPAITAGGNPDIDGDGDVDFVDYAWFAMGLFYETSKQIPRGSVVVDGDLSDWPEGVEWIELDKVYAGSPNDLTEARFALQWDANTNKVYAAVVVNDTNHFFLDEYINWDASDRIEVYSQGDAAGGSGWYGIYDAAQHYYMASNTSGGSWATWALGQTLGEDVGLEYAVDVNGAQIIYEVGVRQFDNYGGFSGGETVVTDLHAGHVVGFDIVACTRWDTVNFGMLSENLMTGKYKDAGKFAKYILVHKIFSADMDGNGENNYADLGIFFESWLWGK